MDKWHSGPFISPGCCDLLDDAWRDASVASCLGVGIKEGNAQPGAVRIDPELSYCAGGKLGAILHV